MSDQRFRWLLPLEQAHACKNRSPEKDKPNFSIGVCRLHCIFEVCLPSSKLLQFPSPANLQTQLINIILFGENFLNIQIENSSPEKDRPHFSIEVCRLHPVLEVCLPSSKLLQFPSPTNLQTQLMSFYLERIFSTSTLKSRYFCITSGSPSFFTDLYIGTWRNFLICRLILYLHLLWSESSLISGTNPANSLITSVVLGLVWPWK